MTQIDRDFLTVIYNLNYLTSLFLHCIKTLTHYSTWFSYTNNFWNLQIKQIINKKNIQFTDMCKVVVVRSWLIKISQLASDVFQILSWSTLNPDRIWDQPVLSKSFCRSSNKALMLKQKKFNCHTKIWSQWS